MQITLTTNGTITLVRLRLWFTYYGLLAGIPFRASNQEIIDRALAKAKAECMQGLNPLLIPPVVTQRQYRPPPDEIWFDCCCNLEAARTYCTHT